MDVGIIRALSHGGWIALFCAFVVGCGSSSAVGDLGEDASDSAILTPDVGGQDMSPDAPLDLGLADVRPDTTLQKAPIQTLTSGSAAVHSTNFKLRLSVGLPAPMGQSQSTNFKLMLGPEAVR